MMKEAKAIAMVLKKHFPNLTVSQVLDIIDEILTVIEEVKK